MDEEIQLKLSLCLYAYSVVQVKMLNILANAFVPMQQHSSCVHLCMPSVGNVVSPNVVSGIVFEAQDREGESLATACLLLVVCLV